MKVAPRSAKTQFVPYLVPKPSVDHLLNQFQREAVKLLSC